MKALPLFALILSLITIISSCNDDDSIDETGAVPIGCLSYLLFSQECDAIILYKFGTEACYMEADNLVTIPTVNGDLDIMLTNDGTFGPEALAGYTSFFVELRSDSLLVDTEKSGINSFEYCNKVFVLE